MTLYTPAELELVANLFGASIFLHNLCVPAHFINDGLLMAVNQLGDDRKATMLDELVRIGVIEDDHGRWVVTNKGREINDALSRLPM